MWINGRQQAPRIAKDRLIEGWQRQPVERFKAIAFRLPCMAGHRSKEHFFQEHGVRKRRRKKVGWIFYYDQNDVVFSRFINRFYDEGNLAIGEERCWGKADARYLSVEGIDWPLPKAQKSIVPRKSKIASQPKDETDYVYLIRMGRTNFYKIGKSNDPQGRLAGMQTASPYKLKLIHIFKADNAAAAEEILHHRLHEARMEGEWFKLTDVQREILTNVTAYETGQFIIGQERLDIERLFSE